MNIKSKAMIEIETKTMPTITSDEKDLITPRIIVAINNTNNNMIEKIKNFISIIILK